MVPQHVPQARCSRTHGSIPFSQVVKDTVYALAAVFTHHAWINSPFSEEGNYMVPHVVELGNTELLGQIER